VVAGVAVAVAVDVAGVALAMAAFWLAVTWLDNRPPSPPVELFGLDDEPDPDEEDDEPELGLHPRSSVSRLHGCVVVVVGGTVVVVVFDEEPEPLGAFDPPDGAVLVAAFCVAF
jgi:hypothetical protein